MQIEERYTTNINAYSAFIRIEIGIREYLIALIKEYGIKKWFHEFLGSVQRDQLNELVRRLNESKRNNSTPNIEDQYLFKLNRLVSSKLLNSSTTFLYHPFYYLSWPDLESLIRNKNNSDLIDKNIGAKNRELLVNQLGSLNSIRNDVAHSRLITNKDYEILNSSYSQIKTIIPDFDTYLYSQSSEENLEIIFSKLNLFVEESFSSELLNMDKIELIQGFIESCICSFWINSIKEELLPNIEKYKRFIESYRSYRKTRGGLYYIIKLKEEYNDLFKDLQIQTRNG